MTIKQHGGIFGRNPTFNNVDVDGTLSVGGAAIPSAANTAKLDTAQTFTARQTFDKSSDGNLIVIANATTTNGVIRSYLGDITIGTNDTGLRFYDVSNQVVPVNASNSTNRDNAIDLGNGAIRFDDVFATNGTINTSDQNEKQQIAPLTDAEIVAAKAISGLFKTFKWNSKVEEKGDAARTHTGVIAQEVQAVMSAAGLDAANYAFWCSDTWWQLGTEIYQTQEEAPEGATQRTRLGIRYPELLAFVGAATEQRLTSIEARLTALESA